MFENVNANDTLLAKLLTEIEEAKKSKNRSYPFALRKRVMDYVKKTNIKLKKVSEKTGIPVATLRRWQDEFFDDDDRPQKTNAPAPMPAPKPEPIADPHPCYGDLKVPIDLPPAAMVDDKAVIRMDGLEVEIPLHALAKVLKELRK